MNYNYRYRLTPTEDQRETLDYHRDTCRQLYNHALSRFNQISEDEDTVKQRVRTIRDELPDLKDWWDALTDIYSKVLQPTVMRIEKNIKALGKLKEQGYKIGELRWKSPREFRSFTYNQSGFELDNKSGQTVLSLSKLADIPIEVHRPLPDDATVKEVTLKKEKTGEWFAIFGIEMNTAPPAKPPLAEIEHSCPACGFEADRDANAAWNILSRGLTNLGVGHSEGTSPEIEDFWCANESPRDSSTPVETALPAGTTPVPANASWKQEAPPSASALA